MSWPLRIATLKKGVGFSLASFMAAQTDGLWYDFSKTDRLFQENVGPTPAATANDVIGLALSQRLWGGQTRAQYLAAQSDLLGAWVDASTAPATFTYVAGVGTLTGDGTNRARGRNTITTVVGRVYALSATYGGLGVDIGVGSTLGGSQNLALSGITGAQTHYFVATATTTYIQISRQSAGAGTFSAATAKAASDSAATQSTAGFKPKYQTAGAAFDGSDDNLLTTYLAQNGANFIVGYVDVPAAIPATQVLAGASGAAANRCFLAFNTSGQLCGGVGSDSTTTILGTTDWRGQTVVVGLSFDGSTVKLFAGTAEEYSAAQNSTPTTSIPFRLGALNNNGTAGSFSNVFMKRLLVGRQALTLAQFNTIRTQLIAGA